MPQKLPPSPLTVDDCASVRSKLHWCYEGAVSEHTRHWFSNRRDSFAWLLLEGAVEVRRAGRIWSAGTGEWLLGGMHPHRQDFSADARILSVSFRLEWPSGEPLVAEPLIVRKRDFPRFERAARSLSRFVNSNFPGVRIDLAQRPIGMIEYFELQKRFSAWVVEYLKAVTSSGEPIARASGLEPRILKAVRVLDRQPMAERLSESELAERIGVSAGHLDRLFVAQLGMTPRAYLEKRRIETAQALLSDPAVPIKRIAYDLGFGSASHFCHWLRHCAGKSPRELRNELRAR